MRPISADRLSPNFFSAQTSLLRKVLRHFGLFFLLEPARESLGFFAGLYRVSLPDGTALTCEFCGLQSQLALIPDSCPSPALQASRCRTPRSALANVSRCLGVFARHDRGAIHELFVCRILDLEL